MIPSIRFRDLSSAVSHYTDVLGFTVIRRHGTDNVAVSFEGQLAMLESVGGFFSAQYNELIAERVGQPGAISLYVRCSALEEQYKKVLTAKARVVDDLRPREWGQTEFTVLDCEGNFLTFYEPLPKKQEKE